MPPIKFSMVPPIKSDLLNRVGAFLPQIKAANQQLDSRGHVDDDAIRVDLHLEHADHSGDDDDSAEDDQDRSDARNSFFLREHDDDPSSGKPVPGSPSSSHNMKEDNGPTIQLEFAIGQFDNNRNNRNPILKLLVDDEQEDDCQNDVGKGEHISTLGGNDGDDNEEVEDDDNNDKKRHLFLMEPTTTDAATTSETSSRKRPKGPLITELS